MAEEKKKKRRVIRQSVKSQTVREKREKVADAKPKRRRVRQAAVRAKQPLGTAGRRATKTARPLRFLLKPFRTKPARLIGKVLYKVLLISYFRNSWAELRLVRWPNRHDTFKLTLAVIVFATGFALVIKILDFGLEKLFKQLLV